MTTLLELLSSDPRFIELEQKIISAIVHASTPTKAFDVFREMGSLIPDWSFIFASRAGPVPGFTVNKVFTHGATIVSPFSSDKVLVLDKDTLHEMDYMQEAKFKIDYSIALDTQAMSYLVPFLGSGSDLIPKDMNEVFAFLAQENVFVDPMPYVLENLEKIHSEEDRLKIIKNIEAYEKLRNIDSAYFNSHGLVRAKLSDVEMRKSAENFVNGIWTNSEYSFMAGSIRCRQKIMLIILLKTVAIHLLHPGWSHQKKLSELLDFMNDRMGCIFQREVITASKYFVKGQKFSFFSKMQKNQPLSKILSELSTMAWDYWHVRHIEESMKQRPDPEARYFFAALLTFDRRYIDLLSSCTLRAYAVKRGSDVHQPYYSGLLFGEGTESFEVELYTRYYSEALVNKRRINMNPQQLKATLPELEAELIVGLAAICKS
jgi:hypothetical protein